MAFVSFVIIPHTSCSDLTIRSWLWQNGLMVGKMSDFTNLTDYIVRQLLTAFLPVRKRLLTLRWYTFTSISMMAKELR